MVWVVGDMCLLNPQSGGGIDFFLGSVLAIDVDGNLDILWQDGSRLSALPPPADAILYQLKPDTDPAFTKLLGQTVVTRDAAGRESNQRGVAVSMYTVANIIVPPEAPTPRVVQVALSAPLSAGWFFAPYEVLLPVP